MSNPKTKTSAEMYDFLKNYLSSSEDEDTPAEFTEEEKMDLEKLKSNS